MRSHSSPLRGAATPLTALSLGQILAVSLVLVLAIVGTIFLLANPTLAVGFVAGLLTAWVAPKLRALRRRVGQYRAVVATDRVTTGK